MRQGRDLEGGRHPDLLEPGLDDVVAVNSKAGRLSFTTDLKEAVKDAEAVFIAVGTPSRRAATAMPTLSRVFAAAEKSPRPSPAIPWW
jgi:UDPglucose 6-dehydrogenase